MSDEEQAASVSSQRHHGNNRVAACIKNVATFSHIVPSFKFDKPGFNQDALRAAIPVAAPKLQALLDKIATVDNTDMKLHGKYFKHVIYVDYKGVAAKIVTAALIANGFKLIFNDRFSIDETPDKRNVACLNSTTLYDRNVPVKFRKDIISLFNRRPDNVHGKHVRFLVLDSGFREGIDCFDVKYMHIIQPLATPADSTQAIGRATRFCGQKGLVFHPSKGWPLTTFTYDIEIPHDLHERIGDKIDTMFQMYMDYSGVDMRRLILAKELDKLIIEGAVDASLTKAIHNFSIKNSTEDTEVINIFDGGVQPRRPGKREAMTPLKIHKHNEMTEYIQQRFKQYTWPEGKLENLCEPKGGGKSEIVQFTPTQDFVRHYFKPMSAYKGLLLDHGVGTGKCHSRDTPILMYDGTIKKVQDVQVGDLLMGDDSTPRTVLSLATGIDDMYDVIPSKGDSYGVNSEHILCLKPNETSVYRRTNGRYAVTYFQKSGKSTSKTFKSEKDANAFNSSVKQKNPIIEIAIKDFLTLPKKSQQNMKGYRVGVEFANKPVPIEPYILGAWLGSKETDAPNDWLMEFMEEEIAKSGASFTDFIREHDLEHYKHIPQDYLVNSREKRLRLLAGMIDMYGSSYNTSYEVLEKSCRLTRDILYLARSLGFAAYSKVGENRNRISITGSISEVPVLLPSKKAQDSTHNVHNVAFKVRPTGRDTYYGFTLDGNNRYLLGDFTVTHNTCCAIATATSSWEVEGYTILWVTRHTLKADIWKNMFQQVCSLVIQDKLKKCDIEYLDANDAVKEPLKHLSKSWMMPCSFKQFSNLCQGKNDIHKKLVQRNGAKDPLKKTLIILDEAHKVYAADVVGAEKPDAEAIKNAIHKSYTVSGKDSVRLLLMTATPYTSQPMDMMKLLNLMRPSDAQLPDEFDDFAKVYLDAHGSFTPSGKRRFLDDIAGYISYLNRERDARQFAYPKHHRVLVGMSRSQAILHRRHQQELQQRITDLNLPQLQEELAAAKAEFAEEKRVRKERCKKTPKAERPQCEEQLRAYVATTSERIAGMKTRVDDTKEEIAEIKRAIAFEKRTNKEEGREDMSQEYYLLEKCLTGT